MSILDDARAGMDPDIRPQDDLFGHVNGRWLDETEIPADRSTWGAFVTLADTAEQQVREIIEQLAAGSAEGNAAEVASADNAEDARKVGDLFASFMDTERIDALGSRPLRPLIDAVEGLRDVRDLAAFLGEFERVGGYGLFGSYVNTDDRDSDRYLFHVTQGGLGLPDESYYREEKFAEIREAYVAYLTRLLGLGGHESPEAAAATVLEIDTRLAAGHWERAETRDVQKTYNLLTAEQLRELCPAFDWDAYVTNLGAADLDPERVLAEVCVRQPSYLAHLSTVLDEVPLDDWRAWLLAHVLRSAARLPDRRLRRDQLRLLRPHPQRHPRAAGALEAGRRVRGGRAGGGRRPRVRRPALPADLQGADGRPGRQPAGRLPRVDLRPRLDERGDQAAGPTRSSRPSARRSATPTRSATTPSCRSPPTTCSATSPRPPPSRPTGTCARSAAPVDRDEWFMLPQTVNAYYNPGTNEICFPAGTCSRRSSPPTPTPAENYCLRNAARAAAGAVQPRGPPGGVRVRGRAGDARRRPACCAGGQELTVAGFADDVAVAAELDAGEVVPVLEGEAFVAASSRVG